MKKNLNILKTKTKIELGKNSYYVFLGYLLKKISSLLGKEKYGNKILILSDKNVFPIYGETVKNAVVSKGKEVTEIILPPGEKSKNLKRVEEIIGFCASGKMSRDDTVLTLGGGVISDLGGFAASIYMRGINFISCPTSLLAQVDASIGGKTGINLPFGKNLVGSFYQPSAVYVDFNTLLTLPEREKKQGMAEIIKYGIIKSRKLFQLLETIELSGLIEKLPDIIEQCVKIKGNVVEKDEREKTGFREILNFGHTLGHAIEIAYSPRLNHGESVALGMVGESYLGWKTGLCGKDVFKKIKAVVEQFKLPVSYRNIEIDSILKYLWYDKKVKKNKLRFVLPEKIGTVKKGMELNQKEINYALKEMVRNERY
jgi:3-dehydroquinate synthase